MVAYIIKLYLFFNKSRNSRILYSSVLMLLVVFSVFAFKIHFIEDPTRFFPKNSPNAASGIGFILENLKAKDKIILIVSSCDTNKVDPDHLADVGGKLCDSL